jgi:hypothetical protein
VVSLYQQDRAIAVERLQRNFFIISNWTKRDIAKEFLIFSILPAHFTCSWESHSRQQLKCLQSRFRVRVWNCFIQSIGKSDCCKETAQIYFLIFSNGTERDYKENSWSFLWYQLISLAVGNATQGSTRRVSKADSGLGFEVVSFDQQVRAIAAEWIQRFF